MGADAQRRSAVNREKRDAETKRQQREARTTGRKNEKKLMLDFVVVPVVFFVSLFVIARAARLVAISS